MNSFIYHSLIFILFATKPGYSTPNGAPSSACTSMYPAHNVDSQACSNRYKIQSDKLLYGLNETVQITVTGVTDSDTFQGVLLIAKTPGNATIIGTWSPIDSTIKTVACGRKTNTGITHRSSDEKTSIQAIWSPPSTIWDSTTVIKATVLTKYDTFYVDCFSIVLTAKESVSSTTVPAPNSSSSTDGKPTVATTAAPATGASTTGTLTNPQPSSLNLNISWTYENGVTAVKMYIINLKTSQWVALGLSLDAEMGEDHVFVCKRLANDTISADRLINPGGTSPPEPVTSVTNPGGKFNVALEKLENNVAYCEFNLSSFANTKRRRRDISALSQSTTYIPLIAIGSLDSSNEMIRHTSASSLPLNVQLNRAEEIVYGMGEEESERTSLMKAHGIIMIFTWILFVSTGIIFARYFKLSWPNKKICGKPIWFAVHRTLMSSAAVFTAIAFILILAFKEGKWISKGSQLEYAHSIVGIIVICFAFIQPIMAIFRCAPDAEYRFIFNYLHATVGSLALLLSIVAIFIAMFFDDFNFQENREWAILIGWICWLIVIFLIFTFLDSHFKENVLTVDTPDSHELNSPGANSNGKLESTEPRHDPRVDRIKGSFLFLHIVVALGISLALVIIVGQA